MIGERFTRLVVLEELAERRCKKKVYLCQCDCGTKIRCVGNNLKSGSTNSCGCYKLDRIHATKFVHGRSMKDKTYRAWVAMRSRCNNLNTDSYHLYGGRGIKVCDRWNDFLSFLDDMGEAPLGLSLDRRDNDGNYEPTNCKWATDSEQRLNKRTTRYISAFGEKKPLTVFVREYNIGFLIVWKRLKRGWTAERALTTPSMRNT